MAPVMAMTPLVLRALLKKPGRHRDRQAKGLYFRTVGDNKGYWVFRYRMAGREHEMSLGPYPETTLAEARSKHVDLRKMVKDGIDPMGRRAAPRKPLTHDEAPGLTHLYRHYGFDGALLYVGVSNNVIDRWGDHKRAATWADLVAKITIEHYATRQEAEEAEADAILAEKPRFNGSVRLNRRVHHALMDRRLRAIRESAETETTAAQ